MFLGMFWVDTCQWCNITNEIVADRENVFVSVCNIVIYDVKNPQIRILEGYCFAITFSIQL